jgi:hypothetical protein
LTKARSISFRRSSNKAAGCPIVTELDLEEQLSVTVTVSPSRKEIEAVVPTSVFEAFFQEV